MENGFLEQTLHFYQVNGSRWKRQQIMHEIIEIDGQVSAQHQKELVQLHDPTRYIELLTSQHAQQQLVRIIERLVNLRQIPRESPHIPHRSAHWNSIPTVGSRDSVHDGRYSRQYSHNGRTARSSHCSR